ncbi:hypothetical protein [Microbulbifer epialgicus]|uniref:Uncharacterized protein n=1 Tax=Microbulbifer epialgicus TaxID=393907 RepID=A0ABV4P0N8_9GAMM
MGRKKNPGPARRQRPSLRSGFMNRHRLRVRQLQARRTRLRSYLSFNDKEGAERDHALEEFIGKEVEEEVGY